MKTLEKEQTAIKICMACDDNYAMHCGAAIASMIDNHKSVENLEFFVLNSALSKKSKARLNKLANTEKSSIRFITVNADEFKNCPIPKGLHFTLETYFRLKLPDFFPDFDKILYIDCDVTVQGDIKELWDFDVESCYAAACQDITPAKHLEEFIGESANFNAGVMVINLKSWREERISQKCFDFINLHSEKIIWVDQDVLNSVLINKMRYFPRFWNLEYTPDYDVVSKLYPDNAIKLIHHITRKKPWNTPKNHLFADKYFKYLAKTPWAHHVGLIKKKLYLKTLSESVLIYFRNFKYKNKIERTVKNRKAVLWGASIFIQKIILKFGLSSENIIGIIDKDPKKRGSRIGRYEVFSPKDLIGLNPDLIISCVLFQPKMKQYIEDELTKSGLEIEIKDDLFSSIQDY